MITVRTWNQKTDAAAVHKLLGKGGELDPAHDMVAVVECEGRIVGALVARPMVLVHELSIDATVIGRRVADLLMAYMTGALAAIGQREAVLVVERGNDHMRDWLEGHGAAKQPEGDVYCVRIR